MDSLSLIIGIIVGAVVASVACFAAAAAKRKKLEGQKRAKEEVMASIGELLADADAYEASYRCGTLTADSFSRGLIDRVNAISRPLRTNMHILDVFFVKYAEQQVDEYMRMIENPERRAEALKAIRASISEVKEEADRETRFGLAPAAAAGERETDAISVEERGVADAGVDSLEESPAAEAGADEDAFELPEAESAPAPEPEESIIEDVEAEEAPPPEEQFFGESPAPAVPEEEQVFGESSEPPASEPEAAADDSWSEKSLEEFEAGFAQFEPQEAAAEEHSAPEGEGQAEQSSESGRETGGFVVSGSPADAPEPESGEEEVFDAQTPPAAGLDYTETMQFDRSALAEAAAGYASPPIKPEAAPKESVPPAVPDGITGDDVSDAIDSFFKIK